MVRDNKSIPPDVTNWLMANRFGQVQSVESVSGGCINNGTRLVLDRGETLFLKTNPTAPKDMFAREAEGLQALCVPGAPRVPRPLLNGTDFLLLEDLHPASHRSDYWQEFGLRLATLHNQVNKLFGFTNDNYLGSTHQPNPWTLDGFEFFAEHRLGFQARLAFSKGYLAFHDVKRVEKLASRLTDLIPVQPASLLHGDLWSGNAISDAGGMPAIIDPAVYYGWAEAELAMTALFGAFPSIFYQSYQEVHPLETGFRERFPIYNLYHLINHLNLFGSGYAAQVHAILDRFA